MDKKASEKKEDEDDDNSKNKLKRVFPDNIEKTEKCIQGLKSKIEKLEAKLRRKVKFFFSFCVKETIKIKLIKQFNVCLGRIQTNSTWN